MKRPHGCGGDFHRDRGLREGMPQVVQAVLRAHSHSQGENAREPLFGSDFVTTYGGESDIEESSE